MVFEAIFNSFEGRVIEDLEKTKTPSEIETMLESGEVQDLALKQLSKALAVTVYRNSKIEDVHVKSITDEEMREINIDVCDRIYTMLKLFISTEEDDFKRAFISLSFGELLTKEWSEPKIVEELMFLPEGEL